MDQQHRYLLPVDSGDEDGIFSQQLSHKQKQHRQPGSKSIAMATKGALLERVLRRPNSFTITSANKKLACALLAQADRDFPIKKRLTKVTRPNSSVILYTILIALLMVMMMMATMMISNCDAIAPTIDYSHNMRVLKLPHSTPVGSLIYRLKGSDGDPHSQLVFGLTGIVGRALVDIVPVAHSWNEADVFLRAPLEEPQYNLTIYVTDGNKTTQVESTIIVSVDDSSSSISGGDESNSNEQTSSTGNGDRLSPFLNSKHVFHVPENTELDETIGFVVVRESQKSDLPVRFELRGKGADKFSIKYVFGPKGQSKAELVLAQRVDYERQNLFNLKVLALNAWTNARLDTRNVATMDIVITVGDVQDTAPVFKNLPHSLKLTNTMLAGDVLIRIEAEDGDYADQRPVNYALDAASPLASYFDIDKQTGEIKLVKSMSELALHAAWDSAAWSVLAVYVSEVPDTSSYDHLWPPMYAKAELPLMMVDVSNEPPQFIGGWQTSDNRHGTKILHGYLTEPACALADSEEIVNSIGVSIEQNGSSSSSSSPAQPVIVRWFTNSSNTGSHLVDSLSKSMNGRPSVLDLGLGSNGTFQLTIEGPDARLFQLEPNYPVTKQTTFTLLLADNVNRSLFDHDHLPKQQHSSVGGARQQQQQSQRTYNVEIVARDFGSPKPLSSRIKCLIELLDVNDNSPQFDTDLYSFSVYENAQVGQVIGAVHARDPDSGQGGRIKYTSLTGHDNQLFRLDSVGGQVVLESHLDREKKSSYLFLVEARDSSGMGTSNYSQVLINVLDTNDNAPVFLQSHYDAVLLADGIFHQPLVVRAIDADEPDTANSQVAYEIIAGNQNDQFVIDSVSGVIYPAASLSADNPSLSSSTGKITSLLPQISPTLTEPIIPFSNGRNGNQQQPNMGAGKILPSHEVEETTWPTARNSRLPSHNNSGGSINQTIVTASTTTVTGDTDSHIVQFNKTTATSRFGWPRSTDSQIRAEATLIRGEANEMSTPSNSKTAIQQQARSENIRLPDLGADQLPALDLLMSLDSDQIGEVVPMTTPATQTARHSIEPRTLSSAPTTAENIIKLPPVTTLIVRAHDFGIPLRSSTVKVNIYNQVLQSRSVSVILNGTAEQLEQRREAIERAFSSITGSKATIESIDALSESSSISVARVKLALPQHSLVDLTDFSALMNALDYHGPDWQARHHQHLYYQQPGQLPPTTITHYIATGDRLIPTTPSMSSNITTGGQPIQFGAGNVFSDIHSYAIDTSSLERRLLIYIIIVGVCILALLIIWMIYSCSREDREAKIIKKSVLKDRQAGSGNYRSTTAASTATGIAPGNNQPRGAANRTDTNVASGKTYAKTMAADGSSGSPIGNNLAKTQASFGKRHQMMTTHHEVDSSVSNVNELLLPSSTVAVKPDHYSMYNGQVWFEPSRPFGGSVTGRHMLITGRRASSAPSGGSLDSALHSTIGGRGSATPRQGTGQFFPNTVGYMENIASLTSMHPDVAGNRLTGDQRSMLSRRYRKRKVVPMSQLELDAIQLQQGGRYLAPDKPPRLSMRTDGTEAFASDLEAGGGCSSGRKAAGGSRHQQQRGRHTRGSLCSRSSSAVSFEGAETMVLDSDQELLGFDSTGTPIIATHTRAATVKPLIIDMLDAAGSTGTQPHPDSQQSQPQQQVAVAPQPQLNTLSVAEAHGRDRPAGLGSNQMRADGGGIAPTATPETGGKIERTTEAKAAGELAPSSGASINAIRGPESRTTGGTVVAATATAGRPPCIAHEAARRPSISDAGRRQQASDFSESGGRLASFGDGGKGAQKVETLVRGNEATREDSLSTQAITALTLPGAQQDGSKSIKRTNSQGDLLSELNERLGSRRQQSEAVVREQRKGNGKDDDGGVDGDYDRQQPVSLGQPSQASGPGKPLGSGVRGKLERRVVKSASSDDFASGAVGGGTETLSNMKNGELLEKQSIFALTYSGLATDKPPAGC